MSHITASQFAQRFVSIILDGRDLPKKRLDRHILYISAILRLQPQRQYSERELNDVLRHWTERFGVNIGLDHVTLRRFLVEERFLKRDAAGMSYELDTTDLSYAFERSIELLGLEELISKAKIKREKKRQRYMKESKQ